MVYEIVPVFHHERWFERDEDDVLNYMDGDVLARPIVGDIEFGIHILKEDKEIKEMCDNKMANMETYELYIYENNPELLEAVINVGRDTDSSNDDSYKSVEDEPYKPPLSGFESDNSSSSSEILTPRKKRLTTKKKDLASKKMNITANKRNVTPKKKNVTSKKKNVKTKEAVDIMDENVGSTTTASPNDDIGGPNVSNRGPENISGDKPNSEPILEEVDSDVDKSYVYESENFNSLISSDDEERPRYPKYDDETDFGDGEFKVEQLFDTMAQFKLALKDIFISEGKELQYLKNEPLKVRTKCAEDGCP
ncbi:hypothetical protein Ahy_B08g092480 [Arachis hypogaea]|uniref:Uncharacterized protein n=1 Tax=Arachis hypogaea TaxID=3818 RepID=A0A444Y413_ARAHY|nr:hypothetical protein Ahy_B08g092480 [Arachis hypogaea]